MRWHHLKHQRDLAFDRGPQPVGKQVLVSISTTFGGVDDDEIALVIAHASTAGVVMMGKKDGMIPLPGVGVKGILTGGSISERRSLLTAKIHPERVSTESGGVESADQPNGSLNRLHSRHADTSSAASHHSPCRSQHGSINVVSERGHMTGAGASVRLM